MKTVYLANINLTLTFQINSLVNYMWARKTLKETIDDASEGGQVYSICNEKPHLKPYLQGNTAFDIFSAKSLYTF